MAPFIRGPTQAQVMAQNNDDRSVRLALSSMEAAALNTAVWKTQDPAVRQAYSKLIKYYSALIWKLYKSGKISAREAAAGASDGRNFLMTLTRLVSTPEGRTAAAALKLNGKTVDQLTEGYAQKRFKKAFSVLSETEKTAVYEDVIQAAGRSNKVVNEDLRALGAASRIFWVLTILMAAYDISSARDRVKATIYFIETSAGAILAGEVLGGVVGSFVGPEGTWAGMVVGGIIGAWAVEHFAFGDGNPALTGAR